jgi:histidine triad (HIT) family protein
MNQDCVFCNIVANATSEQVLFQDDFVTAFRDIHPVAPTHILIITNHHMNSVNEVNSNDEPSLGRLFTVAKNLAVHERIDQSGFRLIVNTGPNGGQAIYHLHMHLIGGRRMKYPIG